MLFITYLRLCFFVVKEIKSHIWFFSFQQQLQSGSLGRNCSAFSRFSKLWACANPAHSRLYRITKQQLQSSRLQQCRAFIGLSICWKKADCAANLFFFVTLGNGNPKNWIFLLKQHSAKSDKFSLRIFFKKCPAGSLY